MIAFEGVKRMDYGRRCQGQAYRYNSPKQAGISATMTPLRTREPKRWNRGAQGLWGLAAQESKKRFFVVYGAWVGRKREEGPVMRFPVGPFPIVEQSTGPDARWA